MKTTGITRQDASYLAKAFIVSQKNSVDIDTGIDFKFCEVIKK